jgi:hypothetical protein
MPSVFVFCFNSNADRGLKGLCRTKKTQILSSWTKPPFEAPSVNNNCMSSHKLRKAPHHSHNADRLYTTRYEAKRNGSVSVTWTLVRCSKVSSQDRGSYLNARYNTEPLSCVTSPEVLPLPQSL